MSYSLWSTKLIFTYVQMGDIYLPWYVPFKTVGQLRQYTCIQSRAPKQPGNPRAAYSASITFSSSSFGWRRYSGPKSSTISLHTSFRLIAIVAGDAHCSVCAIVTLCASANHRRVPINWTWADMAGIPVASQPFERNGSSVSYISSYNWRGIRCMFLNCWSLYGASSARKSSSHLQPPSTRLRLRFERPFYY